VLDLLPLLGVGFLLGVRHATDADHVLAVSTFVSRERNLRGAVAIGALWGLGHGLTVIAVGGAIIVFGLVIPPRVGLAMEFAVGVMLALLGLFTLVAVMRRAREARVSHGHDLRHAHLHSHGDYAHSHAHGHADGAHGHDETSTPQAWLDRHFGRLGPYQFARPLVVGVVHGLAGSAAVALLVLAAIREPVWGFAYLVMFAAGTIAGMMLVTLAMAVPLATGAARLPRLAVGMRVAAGALSLVFGLFLMNQVGVVDGLFSAAPRWSPH
jgi:high-affinity nickel-transport protein